MFRLKQDSRDLHYSKRFGTAEEFPAEFLLDTPIPDAIQPPGNFQCTAYTVCDMASDQTGVIYNIDEFFARIPGSSLLFGAGVREAMGEAVKNGLRRMDGVLVKNWSSYWRADTGPKDPFDNTRSALLLSKLPAGTGTAWYGEWVDGSRIIGFGTNVISAHAWAIEGWVVKNGEPMIQMEAHIGYKLYIPRAVYNYVVSGYGAGAFVLSTATVDLIRKRSILQLLIDAYKTLLALLQQKNVIESPVPKPPQPSLPVAERDLINEFCLAIQGFEGWYAPGENAKYPNGTLSWRNNNPGNIRSVDGPFLVFPSYEKGFAYLKDYVTRACTGRHKAYQPTYSFLNFFHTYAPGSDNNQPDHYAQWVADKMKLPVTTQIKDLV